MSTTFGSIKSPFYSKPLNDLLIDNFGTLNKQLPNTVLIGPINGSSSEPTFRALAVNDIPSIDISKISTGTLSVLRGGTGATTIQGVRDAFGISSPGYNYAINGNLQSVLAGSSFSAVGQAMEMWRIISLGIGGAATVSRQSFTTGQTEVPGEPSFFLRWTQTTLATTQPSLAHTIEDARTLAGQWVTVSFYAKANAVANLDFFIRQSFGTTGSPSADVNTINQTFFLSTSFQKFIYRVQLPSIIGKTFGSDANSSFLRLFWNFPINTTFTIDIANLKVEYGQVDTPYENIDDAWRIARYYQISRMNTRFVAAAVGHIQETMIPFQRVMRTTPTATLTTSNSRANQATGYPQFAGLTNIGGRFLIASAAAGDCYALMELLVLDARL